MWRYCLLLVFKFASLGLYGQELGEREVDVNPWVIGLGPHYGFIIPHSTAVRDISYSRPWGLQLDVNKQLIDQDTWDYCNCFPRIGASLAYYNFDNPAVLGSSLNGMAFIEPFMNYSGKIQGSFKLGAGLSYLNNIYHPDHNPDNLFYSSPVSFILQAQLRLYYQLDRSYRLFSAVAYSHISNGGTRQPNKGINFPTASVGLEYNLVPFDFPNWPKQKKLEDFYDKRWFFTAFVFSGRKEVPQLGDNNYMTFGINAYASRVVTKLNALSLGIEWLSDRSVREKLQAGIDENGNSRVLALMVGHEFLLGRFIFNQQLGAYLEKPLPHLDRIYHRWGLNYELYKGLVIGANLKAHRHIADMVDFRVGYRW